MAVSEGFATGDLPFQGGEGGGDMDAGAERLSVAPLRPGARRVAPRRRVGRPPNHPNRGAPHPRRTPARLCRTYDQSASFWCNRPWREVVV